MKIKTVSILGMIMLLSVAIPAVYAKGSTGKAGKSDVQLLYLFEKTPSGEWLVVEGGAWGKMKYNVVSGDFVFNGHGLEVRVDYTLINFARNDLEWPAIINILGAETANGGGNIHIAGNYDGDLLHDGTPGGDTSGAKIWLVKTLDIVAGELSGWNPAEYLFEAALIDLP